MSVTHGNHNFKFGGDINFVRDEINNLRFAGGEFSYTGATTGILDFIVDYQNFRTSGAIITEMYFIVEAGLREQILERNAQVPPEVLEAALAKARERMGKSAEAANDESRKAAKFIQTKKAAGELNARLLISLFREGKKLQFVFGLAEMTSLDPDTASALLERSDIDGLAMICRAANIERPLFVTIAVLACGGDTAMGRAEEFGRMYNSVPVDAAQRAMRFFKARKSAEARSAA
jgi:uncharacterized protein (DUF2336 family)